jgi:hypothetical protein
MDELGIPAQLRRAYGVSHGTRMARHRSSILGLLPRSLKRVELPFRLEQMRGVAGGAVIV